MSDQTQATLSTQGELATDTTLSAADREVLRRLAVQVAELAARPIEQYKRDLWYRHNALEPTRPLIFCDPEIVGMRSFAPNICSVRGHSLAAGRWRCAKRYFGAPR